MGCALNTSPSELSKTQTREMPKRKKKSDVVYFMCQTKCDISETFYIASARGQHVHQHGYKITLAATSLCPTCKTYGDNEHY